MVFRMTAALLSGFVAVEPPTLHLGSKLPRLGVQGHDMAYAERSTRVRIIICNTITSCIANFCCTMKPYGKPVKGSSLVLPTFSLALQKAINMYSVLRIWIATTAHLNSPEFAIRVSVDALLCLDVLTMHVKAHVRFLFSTT